MVEAGAPSPRRIGVLGAGRQAIETDGYCREEGFTTAFFLEDKPPGYPRDPATYGAPILAFGEEIGRAGDTPAITAVGSPDLRRRFAERWAGAFVTVVSSRAWLAQDVFVGTGTTVAPNSALNRFVTVGDHVLINVGVILSHDVSVGDFVTISPGCVVGGGVTIEPGAFLGIGATVRDHVAIGRGAVIAAGALVVEDVGDHVAVMGAPARRVSK